jgi:ribosomal protein S18 acetylase RimI-like enzyme
MAIELRPAGAQDGDAIAAVFGAARRGAMAYLPDLHTATEDRAHFAGVVADGGSTVAALDGRVVAFIALGAASVEHLYVDPAHWRRGIGTVLLGHAQAARPGGLDLWVFQRNTVAIAFYERHGFRIAEQTDGAGNEEREPDARMIWPGAQRVTEGA